MVPCAEERPVQFAQPLQISRIESRAEMAASSVAEPATCLPLSPNPDSPSSQSPPPPPPSTTSGLELQDPLSSDREHEQQMGVLLSPNKSQRAPDFLPPQMLQALKQQQQQQQLQWNKEQSTSPGRLQQSPKKDNEVCFVRSSFLLFAIFSPTPTS